MHTLIHSFETSDKGKFCEELKTNFHCALTYSFTIYQSDSPSFCIKHGL